MGMTQFHCTGKFVHRQQPTSAGNLLGEFSTVLSV